MLSRVCVRVRSSPLHQVLPRRHYTVPAETRSKFLRDGWAVLPNFLSAAELEPISRTYDEFMSGAVYKRRNVDPKKDFCDMSQPFETPFEKWQIVNAMLPRVYEPALVGNIYEKRAAMVAKQLFPDVEMVIDYDQLLNKRPHAKKGIFAWHQDMAYWPQTKDTR
jgi:phytanoyl-CoA hydroxylase